MTDTMTDTMRALTMRRPWSDAIVHGGKRIENRTWKPWPGTLCQVIAIHAGHGYDRGPMPSGYMPPSADVCPVGIVGTARIIGYYDGSHPRGGEALDLDALDHLWTIRRDPWWTGPCGWLLDEVIAIDPIPHRGALGLWRVERDIADLIMERGGGHE